MSVSKKSRPDHAFEVAVQACQSCLKGQCWEGNIAGFHETFGTYLKEWSHKDPYGRLALEVAFTFGALSFQSWSTDRDELDRQKRLRWSAWLSVLPLDMQLSLLLQESREQHLFSFGDIKWSQLTAVQASDDPEAAFRASPLGGWCDAKTPARNSPLKKGTSCVKGVYGLESATWLDVKRKTRAKMIHYATALIAWKEWEKLEEWMNLTDIKAMSPLGKEVYVHHRTTFSRGSTLATVLKPLPFWTAGVFTGAREEAFWDLMARAGGPARGSVLGASSGTPGTAVVPEAFFLRPLAWLEPQAPLGEATASVIQTAALWRQRFFDSAMPTTSPLAKTVPRF